MARLKLPAVCSGCSPPTLGWASSVTPTRDTPKQSLLRSKRESRFRCHKRGPHEFSTGLRRTNPTLARELWNIGSIRGLVSWDQQVNMPPKGVAHQRWRCSRTWRRKCTANPPIRASVSCWPRRSRGNACPRKPPTCGAVAPRLRSGDQAAGGSGAAARGADSKGQRGLEEARAKNDFPLFAPHLGELVALSRETADHLGWQAERYDALPRSVRPRSDGRPV